MDHGTAILKTDKEKIGIITAYLPDREKFAVYFSKEEWITYSMSEEQFKDLFEVHLHTDK
jgi:hypothetical protein